MGQDGDDEDDGAVYRHRRRTELVKTTPLSKKDQDGGKEEREREVDKKEDKK